MKQFGITLSGIRYDMQLEEDFADFIAKDLKQMGVYLDRDNPKPEALLKAYLRLAKQATSYENEIDHLIETLDGLS